MKKIFYICTLCLLSLGFYVPEKLDLEVVYIESSYFVNESPWDFCQDGNLIGGGSGYDAVVTSGTHTIATNLSASAFKSYIEARVSGDVVFINSNVTIDLTAIGSGAVLVAEGVTIASDRGNGASLGALIYTNEMAYLGSGSGRPVFITTGAGARFTGFRFRGPYGGVGVYSSNASDRRQKWGISSNYDNTEVDNMELYDWPYGAVSLSQYSNSPTYYGPNQPSTGHLIHHNYFHNNRQNSFGYSVNVQKAEAVIYANKFDLGRHFIAGDGHPQFNSYEAYCNDFGTTTHHNVDMHAESGSSAPCNPTGTSGTGCNPYAGNFIHIHHNVFNDDGSGHGTNNKENIRISGIPFTDCLIEYNVFAVSRFHADMVGDDGTYNRNNVTGDDQAFQQRNVTLAPNNINWDNNVYNSETPPGQTGTSPILGIDNVVFTSTGTQFIEVPEGTTDFVANISIVTEEVGETYTITKRTTGWAGPDPDCCSVTGPLQLTFDYGSTFTPDFEMPVDAGENPNNRYALYITVTSTSGATFDQNMIFDVTDVDEEFEIYVNTLAFQFPEQTIKIGERVDLSVIFNSGGSTPTNTEVTYFSDDREFTLSDDGIGLGIGTTLLTARADDEENGIILGTATITVEGRPEQGKGMNKLKLVKTGF